MVTALAIFLSVNFVAAQEGSRRRNEGSQSQPTTTSKKTKRGPRAIAVVEFLPNGKMRLVPVALWIEGKYYDASLYGANPEPMALEPETVYEAQSFGEPTGTFTITAPRQVNGAWVADGNWKPQLAMDADVKAKAAKEAAQKSKDAPSHAVLTGDPDSGRPVLKRAPGSGGDSGSSGQTAPSGGSGSSSSGSSSSKGTTSSPDSDRPVMKRPASDSSGKPTLGPSDDDSSSGSSAAGSSSGGSSDPNRPVMKRPASSSATSQTQVDDHDPDRPVMKRPASTTASDSASAGSSTGSGGVTQAAAASNDSDPNRPTLSRTKTYKPVADSSSDTVPSKSSATASSTTATAAAKSLRAYPAISDAGTYESRPLIYTMSSGERQGFEQAALKVAMDEIRSYASKHNGPAIPKAATITDYDARAFDLEYSSSPTVVLSVKLPVAGAKGQPPDFTYFATIVARIDINDQAQKIFSMVSDSKHLDAYPRMELIDAIDADANGRGDLLFRQYSDVGITYGLYRVSPYQIEKIFEGGSSL
jgi:hypothetical protein